MLYKNCANMKYTYIYTKNWRKKSLAQKEAIVSVMTILMKV